MFQLVTFRRVSGMEADLRGEQSVAEQVLQQKDITQDSLYVVDDYLRPVAGS